MRRKVATLIAVTAAVLAVIATNTGDRVTGQRSTTSVTAEPGWSFAAPLEPGWS
ncbi:hypothetical protein ACFTWH_02490 [Streptomyces sp. NPDC057011]|uniref:hypothetical protein n=1 Tax=unclassified Streptomyces TaxID=2593676 RepID=UPI00362D92C9